VRWPPGKCSTTIVCNCDAICITASARSSARRARLWEDARRPINEDAFMLTPPTWPALIVSLLLAAAAVLSVFVTIPLLSVNAFWCLLAAFGTLLVGVFSKTL
jgi:hypothetical protein